MKEYIEYSLYNRDDSPLYLFEVLGDNKKRESTFMQDYEPPRQLQEDYFLETVSILRI